MTKKIHSKISFAGLFIGIFVIFNLFLCISQEKWIVFQSKTDKYTVNYPSDWYLLPSAKDFLFITNFPSDQYYQSGIIPQGGAEIYISVEPSLKESLSDFVERKLKRATTLSEETTEVNGIEAIRATYLYERMTRRYLKYIVVYFSTDTRVYKIGLCFWENDPQESSLISIFDTILSSFTLEN